MGTQQNTERFFHVEISCYKMGKVKESVGLDSLDGPSPSENFNNLIIESYGVLSIIWEQTLSKWHGLGLR